jgi:hypothetical protein
MTTKIYAPITIEDEEAIDGLRETGFVDVHLTVVADRGQNGKPGIFLEDGDRICIWLAPDMARALVDDLTRAVALMPTIARN